MRMPPAVSSLLRKQRQTKLPGGARRTARASREHTQRERIATGLRLLAVSFATYSDDFWIVMPPPRDETRGFAAPGPDAPTSVSSGMPGRQAGTIIPPPRSPDPGWPSRE